jgi:hypothetical protein
MPPSNHVGPGRAVSALSCAVLAAFACLFVLGILVPLYSDEVATKVMQATFFLERGQVVSLLPQCDSPILRPVPLTLYPAGILYAIAYAPLGLLGIKLSGLFIAIAWMFLLGRAVVRSAPDRRTKLARLAFIAALHGFGVLPFVLTSARPEVLLVLCVVAYCGLALDDRALALRSRAAHALRAILFCIITSVFFFAHPKTLLFTPFVLVCAAFAFPWRHTRLVALVAPLVLLTAAQVYADTRAIGACTHAPNVQRSLADQMLDPAQLAVDPGRLLARGFHNVVETPRRISDAILLRDTYPSGWLPPTGGKALGTGAAVVNGITTAVFGVYVCSVPGLIVLALRQKRTPDERRCLTLAIVLGLALAANVFLYNWWNYYNSALFVPALSVVGVLALRAGAGRALQHPVQRFPRLAAVILSTFFAVATLGMALTLRELGPTLVATAHVEGTVLPGQPASVPVFRYAAERTKIRHLASTCGVDVDRPRRLVIDDATYYAFDAVHEPLHILYITDVAMWGADIRGEAVRQFLRDQKATGIVARCEFYPTALWRYAKRENGYCCIGGADL